MPTAISELVEGLKRIEIIRPASYAITSPAFEIQDGQYIPWDVREFIRLTSGFSFNLSSLEFCPYPGLSKKNLNQAYAWYDDPVFPEYDQAFEFASSGEHPISLGVDLSDIGCGRIFLYHDTAHGTDDNAFYLTRSIRDLLQLIASQSIDSLRFDERLIRRGEEIQGAERGSDGKPDPTLS